MSQLDIQEEKKFLYEMIADLIADRRQTTDLIHDFKSRLNEIIRLENLGLDKIPIQSIVDLHNAREVQRMTTNIEREANHIIRKTEKETEVKASPIEEVVIPKAELEAKIELEKEIEIKQTQTKKGKGMSLSRAADVIVDVLKEKGIPLKAKDLLNLVNERLDTPIELSNFTKNTLPRSSKLNPKINRASHGYWQYRN